MPLEVRLISCLLPSELTPADAIPVLYTIETSGAGTNHVGGALRDPNAWPGKVLLVIWTTDEVGSGVRRNLTYTFAPLSEWYERETGAPIPDMLEWTPLAGWMDTEAMVFHITDEGLPKMIPVREVPPPPPPPPPEEGIWGWIRAHPMEIAAVSGGLMIGAAVLTRK